MSEENKLNAPKIQPEEQEIDLIELAGKVWASRKLVFKACGCAVLVADCGIQYSERILYKCDTGTGNRW